MLQRRLDVHCDIVEKRCAFISMYRNPEGLQRHRVLSGDPFSKSDLHYFLSCVFELQSGGENTFGQDNVSNFSFFSPKVKTCEKKDVVFRIIFLSLCFTHEKK